MTVNRYIISFPLIAVDNLSSLSLTSNSSIWLTIDWTSLYEWERWERRWRWIQPSLPPLIHLQFEFVLVSQVYPFNVLAHSFPLDYNTKWNGIWKMEIYSRLLNLLMLMAKPWIDRWWTDESFYEDRCTVQPSLRHFDLLDGWSSSPSLSLLFISHQRTSRQGQDDEEVVREGKDVPPWSAAMISWT